MTPAEDRWLAQVEAGHPPGGFGHREHLLLAWLVLQREPELPAAMERVAATVDALARRHGRPQAYNRTVTDTWVRVLAHCRAEGDGGFDDVLRRHPWLLDKRVLLRHYSSRRLASAAARATWVEPDLAPLP